jgi:transcription elongation factor Elf1
MDPLEPAHIECPYCGEPLEVTVDSSAGAQDYIEDCQVCCKPIQFRIRIDPDGETVVDVRGEDD